MLAASQISLLPLFLLNIYMKTKFLSETNLADLKVSLTETSEQYVIVQMCGETTVGQICDPVIPKQVM